MLDLRLIAESESEAVFDLLRFFKIDESRSHDGSEQDLRYNGSHDPNTYRESLPEDILGALPEDILGALPVDILGALPEDILGALPEDILGALPEDVLGVITRRHTFMYLGNNISG
nr:hypothetical protein [Tanacetum cinerariifolium]